MLSKNFFFLFSKNGKQSLQCQSLISRIVASVSTHWPMHLLLKRHPFPVLCIWKIFPICFIFRLDSVVSQFVSCFCHCYGLAAHICTFLMVFLKSAVPVCLSGVLSSLSDPQVLWMWINNVMWHQPYISFLHNLCNVVYSRLYVNIL